MNTNRNLTPDRKAITDRVLIEANPASGCMQVRPDTNKTDVYMHPIPNKLQRKVKAGEMWEGWWGRNHLTNQVDKTGRAIYVRYFIPVTRIDTNAD